MQFFHIVEVEAGGGFVENVERAAGLAARKFAREFRALRFAAGKSGRGLAELNVAEADVHERFQFLLNRGDIFQNFQRFFDGQIEQIGNRVIFVGTASVSAL